MWKYWWLRFPETIEFSNPKGPSSSSISFNCFTHPIILACVWAVIVCSYFWQFFLLLTVCLRFSPPWFLQIQAQAKHPATPNIQTMRWSYPFTTSPRGWVSALGAFVFLNHRCKSRFTDSRSCKRNRKASLASHNAWRFWRMLPERLKNQICKHCRITTVTTQENSA